MKSKFKLILLNICLLSTLFIFSCSSNSINNDILNIYFFDVGQGDSTLIEIGEYTMLIDSGPRDSEDDILDYLSKLNISEIDYLIATHPHEDHIGNMDEIIDTLTIKNIYAPKITTNTKVFEEMINSIKSKNLKITVLEEDKTFIDMGDNIHVSILYPPKDIVDENLNNYSPIIKIEFNNSSFLFTGDAETEVNDYLIKNKKPIDTDVLKLGHHGSKTSTSKELLEAVSPSLAIASCGENNKYNHPHSSTLKLLTEMNIKLLRTDLNGTIHLSSDGNDIYLNN